MPHSRWQLCGHGAGRNCGRIHPLFQQQFPVADARLVWLWCPGQMEAARSSPMPRLMRCSAPDSGGASSALAAQRAEPVLGTSNTASAALGEGITLLCSALGASPAAPGAALGLLPLDTSWQKSPWSHWLSAPCTERGEGRWARVKGAKLLGWDKGGLIEEEQPCMQAKQSREFIPHLHGQAQESSFHPKEQ